MGYYLIVYVCAFTCKLFIVVRVSVVCRCCRLYASYSVVVVGSCLSYQGVITFYTKVRNLSTLGWPPLALSSKETILQTQNQHEMDNRSYGTISNIRSIDYACAVHFKSTGTSTWKRYSLMI